MRRSVSVSETGKQSAAAKLTKGDPEVTVTEEELYDIIESMTDGGELDAEQGELVSSALSFADVTVESILTARVDVVAFDVETPPERIMERIRTLRHSRVPVYEGSIEHIDLRSLLDEPYFVHQSTNIDELLPTMSSKKLNMAVVTDNYGGTLGIVTVEDILEELVGEIWDEEDIVVETCVKNDDGSFSFDAGVDVETAFEFMDYEDPDKFDFEHKLLGEWTYEQFDTLPAEGDSFTYNGLRVTVEKLDQRRILTLRIRRDDAPEGGEAV